MTTHRPAQTTQGRGSRHPVSAPARVTVGDRLRGLAALLAMAALLLALPVGLVLVLPYVLPEWMRDSAGLRFALLGGDWSRMLLLLFWVAGCAVWLAVMAMAGRETIEAVRRVRAPQFTPPPSGMFSRLVATASLLFAALPAHAVAATSASGSTVTAPLEHETDAEGEQAVSPGTSAPVSTSRAVTPDKAAVVPKSDGATPANWESYTVRRNDTLWKLSEARLGNGRRYLEIFEANRDVLIEPGYLRVGTTLQVPPIPTAGRSSEWQVTQAPDDGDSLYTVQPGDTLREIAVERYDDAERYDDIAAASADTRQPGGERLSDPDHIKPGWILTLPAPARGDSQGATDPTSNPPASDEAAEEAGDDKPLTSQDAPDAVHDVATAASSEPVAEPRLDGRPDGAQDGDTPRRTTPGPSSPPPPSSSDTADTGEVTRASAARAPWLLAGIASGGGILAAGLAAIVLRGRRLQAAFRTPGRMIPRVPEELVPVAATARVVGGPRVPDLHSLDLLLRASFGPYLRQFTSRRPELIAVELTDDSAVLHLAEPADLPAPWEGDGTQWTAPLAAAPDESKELVPFPMLVTVGTDAAGHAWLLDLERLRTATMTGESAEVMGFVRHVVVELAMNPWTINLTTDVIGPLAPGASGLSDHRVEEHDDVSALAGIPEEIRDAYENDINSEDINWYHAVVVDAEHADDAAELADVITADPGRNGLAVIVAGDADVTVGQQLVIHDGRLHVPGTAAEVDAVHLEQEELEAAVQLCRLMAGTTDAAVPINPDARGWRAFVDEAGTPRPDPGAARPTDPDVRAGTSSVLPDSDSRYLDKTANTRDDLARIAPVMPTGAVPEQDGTPDGEDTEDEGLDGLDPTLDQDLADWGDPATTRPRVKVLGPINMRASGPTTKVADKMPSVYAILGFVALHPEGVIASQIAAMAGIETTNVRSRLADVRDWLGNRPDGTPWLPPGRGGRPSASKPPHRFRIDGCLIDADLFLRLKARGYRRGADGIDDFVAALRLVRGQPFTLPHPDPRWVWATEGEHRDAILTAAIIDVAQIVIARAVLADDPDLAHEAYELGVRVDPEGEVLTLSRAMLELTDGHPERARDLAAEIIAERDGQAPDGADRSWQIAQRLREQGEARQHSAGAGRNRS